MISILIAWLVIGLITAGGGVMDWRSNRGCYLWSEYAAVAVLTVLLGPVTYLICALAEGEA
jgi:hypothetical protein